MSSFIVNEIYAPVFHTDKRYIDIWGGRGRGGSHLLTDYFLFLIQQPKYFRGYFVRQTFNDIKDSLFQDFKDRMNENETINIEHFKINENNYSIEHTPTGNKIKSKGISGDKKRTAKMKSLAGATHVAIEEADEISEHDFDQLDLSLRTVKVERVVVLRCFNPPSKSHWIWRDYNLTDTKVHINGKEHTYYSAEPKSTSNILSVHSTYHGNIDNLQQSTINKFESFKTSNPPYYYNQILGLIPEGLIGRIFYGWIPVTDDDYNALDLPKVYVVDFGYSDDPNAVLEVKYEKDYRYFKELMYEFGLLNLEFAKRLRDFGITKDDLIIADYGAGGDLRVAELRRGWSDVEGYPDLRFNVRGTVKGQGSVKYGINKIKECKNYMTESSVNGWREYREYKWALDVDKNPTDNPEDKNNHLMDCRRYFELCKGRFY